MEGVGVVCVDFLKVFYFVDGVYRESLWGLVFFYLLGFILEEGLEELEIFVFYLNFGGGRVNSRLSLGFKIG